MVLYSSCCASLLTLLESVVQCEPLQRDIYQLNCGTSKRAWQQLLWGNPGQERVKLFFESLLLDTSGACSLSVSKCLHTLGRTPWDYFSHLWSWSLNFFCFKALGKKWKRTPLVCACAVVITLETKNVEKRHLTLSNLAFLLIAIDRNGFRGTTEEGRIYKILPQIFS